MGQKKEGNTPDIKDLFKQVKVKAVMSSPPITIKSKDWFYLVEEKLRANNVKHLLVVNDNTGQLCGMITLNDLFKTLTPKKLSDGTFYYDKADLDRFSLSSIMSKHPESLTASDPIIDAMTMMGEKGFGSIPIVDNSNVPVGIITQTDIIKFICSIFKDQ